MALRRRRSTHASPANARHQARTPPHMPPTSALGAQPNTWSGRSTERPITIERSPEQHRAVAARPASSVLDWLTEQGGRTRTTQRALDRSPSAIHDELHRLGSVRCDHVSIRTAWNVARLETEPDLPPFGDANSQSPDYLPVVAPDTQWVTRWAARPLVRVRPLQLRAASPMGCGPSAFRQSGKHLCQVASIARRSISCIAPASARKTSSKPKIADLTPRQLAVLMAVASDEGANQTKLVNALGVDRTTLADIVRRLVRKGLLQRRRMREDARAYAVKLTDRGRRVLSTALPAARRVDERVIGALPDNRRDAFLTALASIVEKFQSLAPPKP